MPARSLSTGTISFGLVTVPVRLYSAAEHSAAISFNMLHDACKTRLKQQYVCAKDGEKVERDDMVKGYEFAKDRYVTFTTEELKALEEAEAPFQRLREEGMVTSEEETSTPQLGPGHDPSREGK